jgi:CheY-like chemotaxis protein
MPRFLIVEDDLPTLESLELVIRTEFPDAEIETAATLKRAGLLVSETQSPYDVAILDVMLPEEEVGQQPDPDVMLCRRIADLGKALRVMHITAHAAEEPVKDHLADFHSKYDDVRASWYSKMDSAWMANLLNDLKAFIHGNRIRAKYVALLGASGAAPAEGYAARRPAGAGGGLTFSLADLCLDVAEHWDDMGPKDQKLIGRDFWVDRQEGSDFLVTLRRDRKS